MNNSDGDRQGYRGISTKLPYVHPVKPPPDTILEELISLACDESNSPQVRIGALEKAVREHLADEKTVDLLVILIGDSNLAVRVALYYILCSAFHHGIFPTKNVVTAKCISEMILKAKNERSEFLAHATLVLRAGLGDPDAFVEADANRTRKNILPALRRVSEALASGQLPLLPLV